MRRYIAVLAAAAAMAASVHFSAPIAAQAQNQSPVVTAQPAPNGTPVPRTPDGRADLSGVWNKAIHQNTSRPVEPLAFTPAGLKAFNEVATLVDPTSRCVLPGCRASTTPRIRSRSCRWRIASCSSTSTCTTSA